MGLDQTPGNSASDLEPCWLTLGIITQKPLMWFTPQNITLSEIWS